MSFLQTVAAALSEATERLERSAEKQTLLAQTELAELQKRLDEFGWENGALPRIRASRAKAKVQTARTAHLKTQFPNSSASGAKKPPFPAEMILTLVTSRKQLNAVLGDLEERYQRDVEARGIPQARMLYWASTFRSVGPLVFAALKRVGVFSLLASAFKRLIG